VPKEHCVFEGIGEFVGAIAPVAVKVQERWDVEPLPVKPEAVAEHHLHESPFGSDCKPECATKPVHGNGYGFNRRPQCLEPPSCFTNHGINLRQRLGVAKAVLDNRDFQPCRTASQSLAIGPVDGATVLPRIEAVRAREHFQEERIVLNRRGHRTGMVERQFDRHDPGIGHQTVCRLEPVNPAKRCRDPDRAALVATQGHGHLAGGNHDSTAGG